MNPKRKQRLIIVLFIVFGVGAAVGLTMFALSQNINLFYSPTQIANGEALRKPVFVRGMVVEDSVKRDEKSLKVTFDITDYEKTTRVHYTGILPDLFREGQGIVAQGELDANNELQATEVLAKHDENYMPPEVAEALEKAGKMPKPEAEVYNK